MATTNKTWTFTGNAEGLVEVGDSGVNFLYLSSDGSPSLGCIVFGGASGQERARTGAGVTWETWGVPAGSTVTQVQITSWRLTGGAPNTASGVHKIRILNSSNTTVHSAGDLVNKTSVVTSWTTYTDGAARAVDASYQSSTTAVKLELEVNPPMQYDDGEAYQYYSGFDTITLTITYTAGAASSQRQKNLAPLSGTLTPMGRM